MSYQHKKYGWIVVCDLCQEFGPIGDRYLRPMRGGTPEEPIHLCTNCRCSALWCETHRAYHAAESLHRHTCANCGGLFTSIVREQHTACPSCRRATAPALPTPQQRPRPQPRLVATVSTWLAQTLQR